MAVVSSGEGDVRAQERRAVEETVYNAESPLRRPRRFASDLRADLRIARRAGWTIFLRALQGQYRQNALGYVWLLVPSAATTLVWVFLGRSGAVDLGTTSVPYAAYVATGTVLWQLFLDGLTGPLQQLGVARPVLRHARLPHESWIVAAAIDALFKFAVRCIPLIGLLIATGVTPGVEVAAFPLAVLAVLALGLSIGVLVSPAGLLFTDVSEGLKLVASFGFFLTPIVYPVPNGSGLANLIDLNPATPVIVTARACLTGSGDTTPLAAVAVGCGSLVLLAFATVLARVARPHVVARL